MFNAWMTLAEVSRWVTLRSRSSSDGSGGGCGGAAGGFMTQTNLAMRDILTFVRRHKRHTIRWAISCYSSFAIRKKRKTALNFARCRISRAEPAATSAEDALAIDNQRGPRTDVIGIFLH